MYQQLPPYSPIQNSGAPGTSQNALTQDPSRRQSLYQPGASQAYPSPCPTPLPVYSQSPDPWGQQNAGFQSQPVSPIMDRKPSVIQSPAVSSGLDCKASIVDFPMDVFELPAELVTAAVPDDDSIPAAPSMEEEILILKARILQMEIEKRGGVIDIAPAHKNQPEEQIESESFQENTESLQTASVIIEESVERQVTRDDPELATEPSEDQRHSPQSRPITSTVVEEPTKYETTQIEIKVATETVHEFHEFEPLSYYPPPPASPAPPPSSLPEVPILQTTVQEITTLSSQLSLESSGVPQAQDNLPSNNVTPPPSDYGNPYPAPLNVTPLRQQTTPLPAPAFQPQPPAPRHASLTPSYQSQYSTSEQPQPPLPSRPQSQIFQAPSVTSPQQEYSSATPQIQAPQPQLQASYQSQYTPQLSGVSGGYNPQTYSPASAQQPQLPSARPQSVYQPLSFQNAQNSAPAQQQQQQSYPPPPPSPNPQQQRPAPPPRPQSVYQPQYAPPAQNTAPISYQQQAPPPPRPQSVYQPQYAPPAPNSGPQIQQEQQQAPRPQSIYQPLQFTPIQAQTPSPITHHQPQQQQQIYAQPQPLKTQPIQRQDSGYYSIPPSRHSSSFSTASFSPSNYSSPQILSPQPTGMLSPQSTTGSLYHGHGRSASVSTMGSPMTPQPQTQMYFPPPPGTPQPPSQNDYFGSKVQGQGYNPGGVQQQQHQQQGYNPGVNQSQNPGQNYGNQNQTQGWQWGMPPPQPDYGAPPPIPQPWK
ncbi:hypothetical protein BKA61DRAFT_590221 [Leptodontidium sp. MPI-SDFR-AT-0119]|nr:hypothetical protein BKA61DRAFT_590221 [Leptodontidium sp. MPI-SDFR-AT-0119]